MDQEENNYIKIIETRFNILEEGEKRTIELALKNIDHKRAFLGTTMTISAAVIAGLFILLTSKDHSNCFSLLVIVSSFCFTIFIISSSIYLTVLLSQEGSLLYKSVQFVRSSQQDFIKNVKNRTIHDIGTYEEYRKQKYQEEGESKQEVRGSSEIYFVLINILFIFPWFLLLALFLLVNI